jgi:hypothetical protein
LSPEERLAEMRLENRIQERVLERSVRAAVEAQPSAVEEQCFVMLAQEPPQKTVEETRALSSHSKF